MKGGHTLDVIVTRATDCWSANFVIDHSLPSDHAAVHCVFTVSRPAPTKTIRQHRVLAGIDKDSLKSSIASLLTVSNFQSVDNVDALTKSYNSVVRTAIDAAAPIREKTMVDKPRAKWFSSQQLEERRTLRKLERR